MSYPTKYGETKISPKPSQYQRELLDSLYALNRALDYGDRPKIIQARDNIWDELKESGYAS